MKLASLEFAGTKFKRYYVTSQNDFIKCCTSLCNRETKKFGIDIETAKKVGWEAFEPVKKGRRIVGPCPGLCPLLSDIRLIQIYDPHAGSIYVFDIFKIGKSNVFSSGIFDALMHEKSFVAHNGIFEIKHFVNAGLIDLKVDCSMLSSIMVDRAEHSRWEPELETEDDEEEGEKFTRVDFSLDACTFKNLGVRISKFYQTSNWNAPDLDTNQINYAALDALLTYEIFKKQAKKIKTYDMVKAYTLIRDMQHVVADLELTGVPINSKEHRKLIKKWNVNRDESLKECAERFGKVNLRSSPQMNKWAVSKYPKEILGFWPKTDKSKQDNIKLSFGKNSLVQVIDFIQRKYKKNSKALLALLKYKKTDKLITTYGDTLQAIVHPITGNIHSSFIIGETTTGRLASRTPNLQNPPRDSEFRGLFTGSKDYPHLLVADYNQIEIRSAAALSHDPVMTNAFVKGIDLHKFIVKSALGIPMKTCTKEERQLGKAVNFGFMFGMGALKFILYALTSYDVTVSEQRARHVHGTFHSLYKVFSKWCDKERDKCSKLGFVRTPLGKMRKLMSDEQYTRAVNTQVQGGAAECIMQALINFRKNKPKNCKLISTVHDEIIVACPLPDDGYKLILEECMKDGFKDVFPDAPINGLVDAHFGKNWLEAKP